jgi:hypothetical protein
MARRCVKWSSGGRDSIFLVDDAINPHAGAVRFMDGNPPIGRDPARNPQILDGARLPCPPDLCLEVDGFVLTDGEVSAAMVRRRRGCLVGGVLRRYDTVRRYRPKTGTAG